MNEVNLNAFQYDFDLTWMSFFQNSTGRTYARYGGREDDGPETHLNKASLVRTMQRVLELHKANDVKPWSKYDPQAKSRFTPNDIPPMKGMLAKRKNNANCIHCHDVKNATLYDLKDQGTLKKADIFGYPSPKQLGILLDSDDQTQIKTVVAGSAAAKSGITARDTIASVNGQRILTFADFTRVLELAPATGSVDVEVVRNGGIAKTVQVPLAANWRRSPDPSWRSSTSAVGPNSGFWANQPGPFQVKNLKLDKDDLALKVVVVWGAWAKAAGIKNGDVVVEFDGLKKQMTIRQLQTHLQLNHDYGDAVKLTVNRKGRNVELEMRLPESAERH